MGTGAGFVAAGAGAALPAAEFVAAGAWAAILPARIRRNKKFTASPEYQLVIISARFLCTANGA
jgi:hypothetical protein